MVPKTILKNIQSALASPGFFRWIVIVFILQAVLSAVFISASTPSDGVGGRYVKRDENGVVPDGHRHLGAIYYYAERPIVAGPLVHSMSDDDLWMGDLVRFPSYLYYYVLSFPVKAAMALHASDTQIVLLVRTIGIILGVCALIVFRRIVQLVTQSVSVQNLSILALSLTGSFVWLAAAENYDVPSLLLWFLFVYAAIALFTKNHAKYLYWMALWFFLLSITKYTYLPFAGLSGLVALSLYIHSKKPRTLRDVWRTTRLEIASWLNSMSKTVLVLGGIGLIIAGGLFIERIGGNMLMYGTVNPECTALHSQKGCMKFGVYARDYRQSQDIAAGTAQNITYTPYGYVGLWLKRYYDSMYVYMGHIYIPRYSTLIELSAVLSIIVGVWMYLSAKRRHIRVLQTQQQWFLLGLVVMLVTVQFLYNVEVIRQYQGQLYAHQGRYLLSAVGFVYILFFILIQKSFAGMDKQKRNLYLGIGLCVATYAVLTTSAVPSFLIHAISPDWYSDFGRSLFNKFL